MYTIPLSWYNVSCDHSILLILLWPSNLVVYSLPTSALGNIVNTLCMYVTEHGSLIVYNCFELKFTYNHFIWMSIILWSSSWSIREKITPCKMCKHTYAAMIIVWSWFLFGELGRPTSHWIQWLHKVNACLITLWSTFCGTLPIHPHYVYLLHSRTLTA